MTKETSTGKNLELTDNLEEIAKAMLKEKMSVEQISKITGLSEQEIEKLVE